MDAFKARKLPLHVLINNAGLQAPYDDRTEEGFEVSGCHKVLTRFEQSKPHCRLCAAARSCIVRSSRRA